MLLIQIIWVCLCAGKIIAMANNPVKHESNAKTFWFCLVNIILTLLFIFDV